MLRLAGDPDGHGFADEPAVARVERRDDGELAIELRDGASLSAFLGHVARHYEIRAIRSEELSLHDVFVGRVGSDLAGGTERSEESP